MDILLIIWSWTDNIIYSPALSSCLRRLTMWMFALTGTLTLSQVWNRRHTMAGPSGTKSFNRSAKRIPREFWYALSFFIVAFNLLVIPSKLILLETMLLKVFFFTLSILSGKKQTLFQVNLSFRLTLVDDGTLNLDNSFFYLLWISTGRWLAHSCVAPRELPRPWRKNAWSSQMWIHEKHSSTSTRKTSDWNHSK